MRSRLKSLLAPAAAIAALIGLSGCIAYPAGYGYGGGYGGGGYYAPAPVVVAPFIGGGYGGWHRGGYR